MIFKPANTINNKQDKAFFIEKVTLYCRIIELACQKYGYALDETTLSNYTIEDFCKIGVIESEADLKGLELSLTKKLFTRFVVSVNVSLKHKDLSKHISLLRNASRKELQDAENLQSKPTMVDFFCGAGGLSTGFRNSGYKVLLANDILPECCETYKYNHPEVPDDKVVLGDIRDIYNNINGLLDAGARYSCGRTALPRVQFRQPATHH